MEEIIQELRNFVVENYLFGEGGDGLKNDDSFLKKGIIDSTGIMELVAHLEKTYHVKIQDPELVPENLDSIERLARFIQRKVQK